ncbi:homocysteine S-methyltransferase family protein [Nioella ostreopsis]|uniref:homocysteine S-methyltransferase family protein n=1 Tax=Nioella ostreopsis TaxID=2448479 RepID=UPI000FD7675E|nr:homocysteine S-methyltransferase family protein [Nioella ostreopsis]
MTQITLLDGSIGQELVHRAGDRPTPLWSTSVMLDRPELVRAVHGDYFAVGASIATTNTYAVLRDRLRPEGLEDRFADLIETALREAEAARDAHGGGRIAGSLGPLRASYRPDLCPPEEVAAAAYGELVQMMEGRVDLFLIETVSSILQARGALAGCAETRLPVWLSVSVDDEDGTRLRSGEALSELAPVVEEFRPDALLVNCSRPEAIAAALIILKPLGLPMGAYANGFTQISDGFLEDRPTVDALTARKDLGPAEYADFAMGWVDAGASVVGGCCEVGPNHIAELARRLTAAGHTII